MTPWLDDGDVRLYHGEALATLREMPSESVQMIMTSPPFWGLRSYIADDHADKPLEIGLEETPDEWCTRLVAVMREARRVLRNDGVCWIEVGDTYQSQANSNAYDKKPGTSGLTNPDYQDRSRRTITPGPPPGVKQKDLVGAPWLLAFALRADGWCLRADCIWSRPNPMPESVTDRPTKAHSYLFLMTKATWKGGIQPHPMSERDATWLAALVDGEGTICFQEQQRETYAPSVSIRLSVVNTNRALLERVAQITSIPENDTPQPRIRGDGSPGRPIYTWQMGNAKAAPIIAAIRPHLIAKRMQAELALKCHALNQKPRGRGQAKTTASELEEKRRLAAACSALNHGEEPDLSWFKPAPAGRWVPNDYMYDADAIREESTDGTWNSTKKFVGKKSNGQPLMRYQGSASQHPDADQSGRNARSVWSIPTEPTPFAHFATMPSALAERCIKAGTSEHGACSECGAPWRRITETTPAEPNYVSGKNIHNADRNDKGRTMFVGGGSQTLGWEPSCDHDAPVVPCRVLDCFMGSGTTALVARRLGRHAIGIELNAEYLKIAAGRLQQPTLWSQPVEQA